MGSEYDDPGCVSRLVIYCHADCVCCFLGLGMKKKNSVCVLIACLNDMQIA